MLDAVLRALLLFTVSFITIDFFFCKDKSGYTNVTRFSQN